MMALKQTINNSLDLGKFVMGKLGAFAQGYSEIVKPQFREDEFSSEINLH